MMRRLLLGGIAWLVLLSALLPFGAVAHRPQPPVHTATPVANLTSPAVADHLAPHRALVASRHRRLAAHPTYSGRFTARTWARLAQCESGGDPTTNTGNGFYGLYQFTRTSWRLVGGRGQPHQASATEQTRRAALLLDRQGARRAWPACSRKLGLR